MTFKTLGLTDPILKAVEDAGYSTPTDIQHQAIPVVLSGKDLIGCARTGTGKTAAFAIPLIQMLHQGSTQKITLPRALIMAPTRELVIQISENISQYAKYLPIKHIAIFGGVSQKPQVEQLKKRCDIIVATPGRLLDLMNQGYVSLNNIQFLVLDEADNMLDMGFIHDIKNILKQVPAKRHTLFFSATMPPAIRKFANGILNNPAEINVNPVSSTAQTVKQAVYFIEKKEKTQLLVKHLKAYALPQSLVFTRTKHGADRLVRQLSKQGILTAAIHGNKSQQARQKALSNFKNGSIQVLIATDIAARGIDIDDLPHVVNYDLPKDSETYVHRIGRTGRAGKEGVAFSFCSEEEKPELMSIQKLIGFSLATATA